MHVKIVINETKNITCTFCDYKCKYNIQLKQHIQAHHQMSQSTCNNCGLLSSSEDSLNKHPYSNHNEERHSIEDELLNIVSEYSNSISKEIEAFKMETRKQFSELSKIVRYHVKKVSKDNDEKCKALGNVATSIQEKVDNIEVTLESRRIKRKDKVSVKKATNASIDLPDNTVNEQMTAKPVIVKTTPFLQQPKVLFVSDSVSKVANLRLTEKASRCRIRSVTASNCDENSRHPENNFADVVKYNLNNPGREDFEALVMSAPTKDISDLHSLDDKTAKARVKSSVKSMVNVAELALKQHKNLKKVIMLEHVPRFDSQTNSALAKLANATLQNLCLHSQLKNKINVGKHNLESYGVGKTHERRYRNTGTGRYDGVHLFGPSGVKDFTESLSSIMLRNLDIPQPEVQIMSSSPILTQNRFTPLSQGN